MFFDDVASRPAAGGSGSWCPVAREGFPSSPSARRSRGGTGRTGGRPEGGSLPASVLSRAESDTRRRYRRAGERHDGDADSIANESQFQPGHGKGCEKDRQEPLSGASEGDDLFPGGVEGLRAARVSSIANLQGVTSRLALVSRSCGSFRPTRPAHRRPRHRTCHDGPRLRLPYASTSASPAFADLLLFLNGLPWLPGDERNVPPARGSRPAWCRPSQPLAAHRRDRECPARGREKGSGACRPWPPMAVPACGRCAPQPAGPASRPA